MHAGRAVGNGLRAVLPGLVLTVLCDAAPARAWTEARVESASAWVDVLDEQHVRVSLELGVRVDGGWLTHLSLRGLSASLTLDADKPPYVLCEDGHKVAPTLRHDASGELVLGFPDRRTAPRRGRHRLGLVYEATLATAGASGSAPTAAFGLPAFLHDLREARIELRAPPGSAAAPRRHDAPGTLQTRIHRSHTTFALRAEHVPRGIPLELSFVRPELAARALRAAPSPTGTDAHGSFELAALAACVLALGALKRQAARRLASAHGARPLPLLALSPRVRATLALGLGAGFAVVYPRAPGAGLLLLGLTVALWLDRGFARRSPALASPWPRGAARVVALGRARRARAARLFGGGAWLDATTPAGVTLLACAAALALSRGPDVWLEALLVVAPLLLTATRLQLPPSRHDALIAHLNAARGLPRHRARAVRAASIAARAPVPYEATPPAPHAPAAPSSAAAPVSADAASRAPDRAA
jgi:hypothetical protein